MLKYCFTTKPIYHISKYIATDIRLFEWKTLHITKQTQEYETGPGY